MSNYDSEGSILYCVCARGTKVLAEFTNPEVDSGNFPRIALQLLGNISLQDQRMTIQYDSYNFHFIVSKEIVFLCLADGTFSSNTCFNFLKDLLKEWFNKFGDEGKKVQNAYQMDSAFKPVLRTKMDYYNHDPNANKIKKVRGQIEELKDEMVKNIDKVVKRGQKMEVLVNKTGDLVENAAQFKSNARRLRWTVLWTNIKIMVIIGCTLLIAALMLFVFICGFPLKCLGISFF